MKNSQGGLLTIIGAALGGWLGYQAFLWLAGQGFYGLVLPGALLGLGAGIFRQCPLPLAIACGLGGLTLGLLAEWRYEPFIANSDFTYFLKHLPELKPLTMVMIAAGAAIAFWVPFRRRTPGGY